MNLLVSLITVNTAADRLRETRTRKWCCYINRF